MAPHSESQREVKGRDGVTRKVQQILTWQQRRERMQDVCTGCHAMAKLPVSTSSSTTLLISTTTSSASRRPRSWPNYTKPTNSRPHRWMRSLNGSITSSGTMKADGARRGASMSGPDYAWWHGIYEVAKSFYMEFLPEMKRVAGEPLASELMEKYVYTQPGHLWLKEGMTRNNCRKKSRNFVRLA